MRLVGSVSRSRRLALGLLAVALLAAGCARSPQKEAGDRSGSAAAASRGGVRLVPDPAFAASRIEVVFDHSGIDASACGYTWKRNGIPIEGATGPFLNPSRFSKGDRVTAEVTVPGAAGAPPRVMTGEVQVLNMPPKVTAAALMMTASGGPAALTANVQSADADGDAVTYRFNWFRNNAPLSEAHGPSLPAAGLSRGDHLQVEVVATDRESTSPPFRSDVFQVQNLPPRITSRPAKPRPSDEAFHYQVIAEDPDQDPVTFNLLTAPKGMKVDPDGLVTWPLPPAGARRGDHVVKVQVSDSRGGEATQEFTLDLD